MKPNEDITQDQLKLCMTYDPETGLFCRNTKPNQPLGSKTGGGYIRLQINGKGYAAHRLAWLYMTGEHADGEIDHINRVRNDNRWANLRVGSTAQNQCNRSGHTNGKILAKGVFPTKKNKFGARVYVKGKVYYSGKHETIDEAAHAYNKMAILHFGEFAALNPIGQDKSCST